MNDVLSEYMAKIGSKGGKKSKRVITPEQQQQLIKARRKKYLLKKKFKILKGEMEEKGTSSELYNRMCKLGKGVMPFILEEFQTPLSMRLWSELRDIGWFVILEKLTGIKSPSTSAAKNSAFWVDWGIKNKIIKGRNY